MQNCIIKHGKLLKNLTYKSIFTFVRRANNNGSFANPNYRKNRLCTYQNLLGHMTFPDTNYYRRYNYIVIILSVVAEYKTPEVSTSHRRRTGSPGLLG